MSVALYIAFVVKQGEIMKICIRAFSFYCVETVSVLPIHIVPFSIVVYSLTLLQDLSRKFTSKDVLNDFFADLSARHCY